MVTATQPEASAAAELDGEIFSDCSFSSLGLHSRLCHQLQKRLGFEGPTLVQAQSIPVILSGRHVLVNAATGTGKTVAYLAPVVHHLSLHQPRIQRSDGTFALVLVPTRELCLQVYEILHKILQGFHNIVWSGYVTGGDQNINHEKARLRKGISILVATPGRLLDHLRRNKARFQFRNLRWLIFDEADRILELDYDNKIQDILHILGSVQDSRDGAKRQNLLLSATLNESVNSLAQMSLEEPVLIGMPMSTASPEDYKLPAQLTQRYVQVPCNARLAVLLSTLKHLFETKTSEKVVVFFSTRDAVDFHYSLLSEFQFKPSSGPESELNKKFLRCKMFRLHGNMEQADRITSLQTFKKEKSALLLSTDVLTRGVDIPKVRRIIQYDPPSEATEYVHRVGRTARLGERGEALLFLQKNEIDYLKELEKHGVSLVEYPLGKLLDGFSLYGRPHFRKSVSIDAHPWVLALQEALESFTDQPNLKTLAKNAFRSWVCAYNVHRGELKRIFIKAELHLGHVAKSFALKERPSLVGKSFHKQQQKRKRDERQRGGLKRRKF